MAIHELIKSRNLLHPCCMKNENNFIRESQTQPGNNYQCEHKEQGRAGPQRGARRLWPGYSLLEDNQPDRFHHCPLWFRRHSEGSRRLHEHGALCHSRATSRLGAECELCLRYHSAYFFLVCVALEEGLLPLGPLTLEKALDFNVL